MISNVALPTTEAAGMAPTAAGEMADTGVFDALLALQSLIHADAETGVTTQLAGAMEGAELLVGTLEDTTEDSTEPSTEEEADLSEGALWFLAAPFPALKVPAPAVPIASQPGAPIRNDVPQAGVGGAQVAASQAGTATDLAQAFSFGAPDAKASEVPGTQVSDTTTWNSLTGPAELFAQTRTATTERSHTAPLTTHVRDPRWAEDLGNRLASMVRTGESSASLQLTPVDLGPLEVNVTVRDNQASVHFGAANAETRALLEASMPRLREMLESQGFQLMDSSVSHGFARQTRHESAGTPRVDALGESPMSASPIHISGLIDLYA